MLIFFSSENYRSIDDRIELDMRAEPRLRRHSGHSVTINKKLKLLRCALLYGANASGKSNIIKSIDFAKRFIVNGPKKRDGLNIDQFSLTENPKEESSFYFEFVNKETDNNIYSYGFIINKKRVVEESLYQINDNSEKCIYERKFDHKTNSYTINSDVLTDMSNELVMKLHVSLEITADNVLFLSDFYRNNLQEKIPHEDFNNLMINAVLFFNYKLLIVFPNSKYAGLYRDIEKNNSCSYINSIKKFDTGLSSISYQEVPIDQFERALIENIKSDLDNESESNTDITKVLNITINGEDYIFFMKDNTLIANKYISIHELESGKKVTFPLSSESDGTRRLLDLMPVICSSKHDIQHKLTRTYIIDEFDRSLHPNVSKEFLKTFLEKHYTAETDQLIVTTHESNLLDKDLLRRDEIWFVQKERKNQTNLYSLSEYSVRFDKDIRSAYLSGRFGAIPYLSYKNNYQNNKEVEK